MTDAADPFAFVKNLFAQSGVPGFAVPPMSEDEIERKLTELKQVENWLTLNLNVLKGQMQALEGQRALVKNFKQAAAAFAQAGAAAAPTPAAAAGKPLLPPEAMMNPAKWMEAMQAHMQPFVQAAQKASAVPPKPAPAPAAKKRAARNASKK